ncbi:MAG: hypothetical protein ACRC6E_14425 [Fusobacteriaceae bacterium]
MNAKELALDGKLLRIFKYHGIECKLDSLEIVEAIMTNDYNLLKENMGEVTPHKCCAVMKSILSEIIEELYRNTPISHIESHSFVYKENYENIKIGS